MFKGLHNRLGENGETLTILSLLQGPAAQVLVSDTEGNFGDISQRLREFAGDDAEVVSMYSVYPSTGGSLEFLSVELLPLRQAIERLHEINGNNDEVLTELSVLDPSVELDESTGPVSEAIAHLRDALRSLFNRAGEDGQHLTVLSLLSHPIRRNSPED